MQVKVLELEKTLENERLRLGELRRQHYALAGIYTENSEGGKPAVARKPGILKKPPVAQKPSQPFKHDGEVRPSCRGQVMPTEQSRDGEQPQVD